jgi:hypothetical protein
MRDTGIDKRIKTEMLLEATRDIADIFNSHHEKIYYYMSEFAHFTSLAN